MNRTAKVWSLLVVLAFVVSLALACAPKATPQPTKAPEVVPTEAKPAEVIELDIFHFYSEGAGVQPELVEQAKKFEEENPQYKIKWTWGGSEALQKLRARINAGDPPDAAINNDANITIFAREGVAVPLDEYLETQNYEGDAKWKDTFWPGVLQNGFIADAKKGPHYYGIPWVTHVSGIYYNKGLFEEKGYQIPKTWSELLALCDRIQEEEGIPCFAADNFNYYNARVTYYIIQRLVGQDVLYDTAMNKPGTSWKDTPEFLQAARMAQELTTKYFVPGWQGNQWPTGQVDWANGGEAMIFMPTWLPSELRETKAEGFVMDIFPVPAIEGGKGDPMVAEMKFNGWFIPEGAKHPDGAIHFIKFLTSRYAQKMNMEAGGLPPAIKGVGLPPGVEGAKEMLEGYGGARFGFGLDADAAEWQQKVFFPLNDQLLFGEITPEEFIEQLQKAHDEFYAARPAEEKPTALEIPEPAEIDVFHFYSEGAGLQPQLVEQTARFEAEHPGWKIKWTWGGSEALQKLRARINAGDPPDIAINNDANITIFAREGVAMPLDEYLESLNYEGDAKWKDTFYEGVLHHGFIEDGAKGAHFYGIPQGMHFSGIFYNKGLFEEKGYQIPKTWSEMLALCDRIQEEVGIPCFAADNFNYYNARVTYYIMRRLVGNQLVYDTAMNKPGTSWKDTPEFLQAARMAQELTTKYFVPGWQGNQWPTGQVDWANGGEAMIFMPSWLPSELLETKAEGFEMDIFPVPAIEGGKGDPTEYEIKFNGWFIPEGAKHPDQAIYFIKYLTSRLCQGEQASEGQLASPIKAVPLPDVLSSFKPILEKGSPVRFGGGLDADAAEWQQKVFFPLNDQLLFGLITPEEFIEQLQKAHDEFYASR